MTNLFNYQTLQVSLQKSSKSLLISFKEEYLNFETLFELESILTWVKAHLEISTIFLSSHHEQFSLGVDKQHLKTFHVDQLRKYTDRVEKLVQAMICLPQTIVIDLKEGAYDYGLELALGADLRISRTDVNIAFNHHRLGVMPSTTSIDLLKSIVGMGHVRDWILTADEIPGEHLATSGLVSRRYSRQHRNEFINELLLNLNLGAPVQRTQTKLAMSKDVLQLYEEKRDFSHKLQEASLQTQDWDKEVGEFISAKDMGKILKFDPSLKSKDLN